VLRPLHATRCEQLPDSRVQELTRCSTYVWSGWAGTLNAFDLHPGQVYDTVKGRLEISSPLEGGECSALVLPPWHYPVPRGGQHETPQVEVVDILDGSGRVVCAGALIAPDWVLTAGACADAASEVQLLGVQRVGVHERVADPRGGTEAVALLRLEHAVCLPSVALRMDDGSNIGDFRPSSDCQHSHLPSSGKPVGRVRTTCTETLETLRLLGACSSPQCLGPTRWSTRVLSILSILIYLERISVFFQPIPSPRTRSGSQLSTLPTHKMV